MAVFGVMPVDGIVPCCFRLAHSGAIEGLLFCNLKTALREGHPAWPGQLAVELCTVTKTNAAQNLAVKTEPTYTAIQSSGKDQGDGVKNNIVRLMAVARKTRMSRQASKQSRFRYTEDLPATRRSPCADLGLALCPRTCAATWTCTRTQISAVFNNRDNNGVAWRANMSEDGGYGRSQSHM